MIIGIDIDGMLDRFADFFQVSIPAWQKAGIKVGILTGRLESDKLHIAAVLAKVGIKMDFLLFKPQEFENANLPNGVWKGILCRIIEADILFDDMEHNNPAFITDFSQVVGHTQVLTPINYSQEPDAEGKTTRDYAEEMIEAIKGKLKD